MNRSETVMLRGRRRTKVRRYGGARREAHRSEAVRWCWEVVRCVELWRRFSQVRLKYQNIVVCIERDTRNVKMMIGTRFFLAFW